MNVLSFLCSHSEAQRGAVSSFAAGRGGWYVSCTGRRTASSILRQDSTMSEVADLLPARRPELLLLTAANGQRLVRDPSSGGRYTLGEHEFFLLSRLDGGQTASALRAAFAARFGENLSAEELGEFL